MFKGTLHAEMDDQSDQEKSGEKCENTIVRSMMEDWKDLEKDYMQLEVIWQWLKITCVITLQQNVLFEF